MLLRKLLMLVIALATACTPVPTTPPATVPSVPTATAVATMGTIDTAQPARTDTPAPTVFSATIDPTMPVPLYLLHPSRVGLGTVDVLSTWCFSKTTAIAVYERSVEWHRDDAAYADCVSRGVLE